MPCLPALTMRCPTLPHSCSMPSICDFFPICNLFVLSSVIVNLQNQRIVFISEIIYFWPSSIYFIFGNVALALNYDATLSNNKGVPWLKWTATCPTRCDRPTLWSLELDPKGSFYSGLMVMDQRPIVRNDSFSLANIAPSIPPTPRTHLDDKSKPCSNFA